MEETESLLHKPELKVYNKRWLIAVTIALQKFIVRYFMGSIGVVNGVYVNYFNISYIAVDWFTTIQYPGGVIINFLIAWLIYANKVGLRKLSIMIGISCIFTSSSMLIAIIFPNAYPIIYLGEFVMGASYSTLLIMAIQMANSWFSQNEIGKAMVAFPLGSALAAIMAFLIPSNIFISTQSASNSVLHHNHTPANSKYVSDIFESNGNIFKIYNGILFAITLMMFVPVYAVVQDQPPTPPTEAQALLRNTNQTPTPSDKVSLKGFLKECRHVLTSKVVLIVCIMESIRSSVISTETMFLSEMLRSITVNENHDSNTLSGYITSTFEAAAFLGLILGAYIFDKFKEHVIHLRLSFLCLFLCQLGLFCGTYFQNVNTIWVFNGFLGFFGAVLGVPIEDTAVQHLYPTKPGLITSLMNLVLYIVLVVIVQLLRLLIMFVGSWAVFVLSSIFSSAAFLLSFVLKPNFKILQLNS